MSKEKQIEEMATDINEVQNGGWKFVGDSEYTTDVHNEELAEHLYNAGYRKQSEGEWTYGVDREGTMKCTLCRRRMPKIEHARYCPNCGAKMKGGKE